MQVNFAPPGWAEIATCLSQSLPELLSQAAGNQDILPLPAVNFYFLPKTFDYTLGQSVWQPDFVMRGIGSLELLSSHCAGLCHF